MKNSFFFINKLLECCVVFEGFPGSSDGNKSAYNVGDRGSAVFEKTLSTGLGSLTFFKLQLKLYYLWREPCIHSFTINYYVLTRRRQWHPTPVLLPGKSHGRRSLEGCSPWGREESDTTERLHFHFSLSCIGAGNSNPLQCSCLENPRDRGSLMGCPLWGHTESDTTEAT